MIITLKGANFSANNIGNIDIPSGGDTPNVGETPINATWVINSVWYQTNTPVKMEGRARTDGSPMSLSKAVASDGIVMTFSVCNSEGQVTSERIMNKTGTFTGFDPAKKYHVTMYKATVSEDGTQTTQTGNVTQEEADNGTLIKLYA